MRVSRNQGPEYRPQIVGLLIVGLLLKGHTITAPPPNLDPNSIQTHFLIGLFVQVLRYCASYALGPGPGHTLFRFFASHMTQDLA